MEKTRESKARKVRDRLRLNLPLALVAVFLYILLHEFGHVIVLWSVEADITEFSITGAHVNYIGGQWTNTSDLWMHLNGTLFPLIVALGCMFLYRRNVENRLYRVASFFLSLIPIASLVVWIVIPFMFMCGNAPEGDDVYKFLYNFTFDHPAWFVSLGATILMLFCIFVAIKKGLFRNFLD